MLHLCTHSPQVREFLCYLSILAIISWAAGVSLRESLLMPLPWNVFPIPVLSFKSYPKLFGAFLGEFWKDWDSFFSTCGWTQMLLFPPMHILFQGHQCWESDAVESWVYFCALCTVPLVDVFVFVPYHYGNTVHLEFALLFREACLWRFSGVYINCRTFSAMWPV